MKMVMMTTQAPKKKKIPKRMPHIMLRKAWPMKKLQRGSSK